VEENNVPPGTSPPPDVVVIEHVEKFMVLVKRHLTVDDERGSVRKTPLGGQVIPDKTLLQVSFCSVRFNFLVKILRFKDLKEVPGQGDSISRKKTSSPQSLFARFSVSEVIACRDLVRHFRGRQEIVN
jgi:hypothetical protein